jgi:hypothetical protein
MSQHPGSRLSATLLGIAVFGSMTASSGVRVALAQQQFQQPALVHGRVVNKASGAAIPGVAIVLAADGRTVATDSAGRYQFGNLPAGLMRFLVHAPGFQAAEFVVDIKAGDDVARTIELESSASGPAPPSLSPVVTEAVPGGSYRLMDFERRRRTGRGQYLTDEEIQKSGAATLQDATRGMRGVTLHCGGSADVAGGTGCRIQVTRAPMNCQPQYVIDGRVYNMFGPLTPIRDIVGLEVYVGATDVPGEFAGSNAGCGVVAVWTRSGPTHRRP